MSTYQTFQNIHENGYEWDDDDFATANAAINSYLECLKYAHENGCEWDEDDFKAANAAINSYLECLKYSTYGCD